MIPSDVLGIQCPCRSSASKKNGRAPRQGPGNGHALSAGRRQLHRAGDSIRSAETRPFPRHSRGARGSQSSLVSGIEQGQFGHWRAQVCAGAKAG